MHDSSMYFLPKGGGFTRRNYGIRLHDALKIAALAIAAVAATAAGTGTTPESCAAILAADPSATNGMYDVQPAGASSPTNVFWCVRKLANAAVDPRKARHPARL